MAETKTKTTKPAVKTTKVVAKKAEVKKAPVTAKVVEPQNAEAKTGSLKITVVGVDGVSKGSMTLPEAVFGVKPNNALIAQAVRVYLSNQRQGNAATKTRGEVIGSTKKIYRQKGTGRARHGAAKAPLFVGGGVAHGPHPHDFSMDFPKKMKQKALISALSEKTQAGSIKIVEGAFSGKTKEVAALMNKLEVGSKGKANKVLFVVDKSETATRAAHNVSGLQVRRAETVSTYEVVTSRTVIFLKDAVDVLATRLTTK